MNSATTGTAAGNGTEASRSQAAKRTMRAIVRDRYGEADVLEVRAVKVPEVADEEVLVRVHAAGLDRGAWHIMAGLPYLIRIAANASAPAGPSGRDHRRRRELACLFWVLLAPTDYAFGQPSLTAKKIRRLEITAGAPRWQDRRGVWIAHRLLRDAEHRHELSPPSQRIRPGPRGPFGPRVPFGPSGPSGPSESVECRGDGHVRWDRGARRGREVPSDRAVRRARAAHPGRADRLDSRAAACGVWPSHGESRVEWQSESGGECAAAGAGCAQRAVAARRSGACRAAGRQ